MHIKVLNGSCAVIMHQTGNYLSNAVVYQPNKTSSYNNTQTWLLSDCLNLSMIPDGTVTPRSVDTLTIALKSALERQEALALSVITPDSAGLGKHAISCWGAEFDDAGNLTALFVTDSDDRNREIGLTRYNIDSSKGSIQLQNANDTSIYQLNGFASLSLGQDYLQIIPEPSTTSLFGGLVVFGLLRRRRKN